MNGKAEANSLVSKLDTSSLFMKIEMQRISAHVQQSINGRL
jgi:hypothetical protein